MSGKKPARIRAAEKRAKRAKRAKRTRQTASLKFPDLEPSPALWTGSPSGPTSSRGSSRRCTRATRSSWTVSAFIKARRCAKRLRPPGRLSSSSPRTPPITTPSNRSLPSSRRACARRRPGRRPPFGTPSALPSQRSPPLDMEWEAETKRTRIKYAQAI